MNDAFYIAATGMQAQQVNLDTIANNLANVNTTGFKKGRVSFSDLMVRDNGATDLVAQAGLADGSATQRLGGGVGIASLSRQFDMGDLRKTDSVFDVAIQGDGFIELSMPDGSSAYTRGGTLKINLDGQLCTQAGYPLKPAISVPDNAQTFTITGDGRVQFSVAGQSGVFDAGQLELVRFHNPGALTIQGDNLYRASDAAGNAIASKAGEDGVGSLAQGFLESSNVKLVDEMVNMMIAQRAYEANLKVVQAADEMSSMTNNLRK